MISLKFVAEVIAGQSPPSEDVSALGDGIPFMQGNAEFGSFTPRPKWQVQNPPKRAEEGDVLVSVRAPVGALNLADRDYGIGRGLAAIRAANLNAGFLWWWLHTQIERLDAESTGSTFKAISTSNLENLEVPNLSLVKQQAIADYLNRETKRIDELITEQRGLIEALRERRRSVMTRLVTRGLDGDEDLVESESRWLDLTPPSWVLTRFRFVAKIDGVMVDPTRGDMRNEVLIAPNHVEGGTGRLLAVETADAQGADSSKFRVREGQVIYSKIRPTLNKAVMAPRDCLCSADMYPISFDSDQVVSRYALYQMLSRPIHDYVTERSMRVKMPKVNREELADLPWLLPPLDVQESISDEIDDQTSRIDALIAESEGLIALSHERRAALITAAVTGQIDVRAAA